MKILLFNLGAVKNRILAWDVDGFKSLFEQDTILWGPVPDSSFSYNGKDIPIINFFTETNIKDVFDRLPENWVPDIVLCDTSVLNYIPDIYKCPVKTILFTRDAWSDTIFNRSLVELFDFIKYTVIDRSVYANLHVNLLPLSGFAVSVPPGGTINSEFEKRSIDLIAIASYNDAFYHERFKILYNLADTNKSRFNIKFFRGIKRSEIYSYYQRSKIVIDWAHTLSNRSFEAALNGCLLFSYENNKLIEDFWIPWEEYIPYREDNLFELINYYISNPEQSKKIIEKAHKKILATPANWGQMAWKNIQLADSIDVDVRQRISYVESLPEADVIHRSATALLYNYEYNTEFPSNWKDVYFERIEKALDSATRENEKIRPLIEAGRMAVLLKRHPESKRYLHELEKLLPEYAWTYYLQARISYETGDYLKSLELLQRTIDCAQKSPGLLQEFVLPVIERGNSCDGRRITNFMWQPVMNHDNEFQVHAMLHLAFELRGQAYQRINEIPKAIDAYCEAINQTAIPSCIYRVSPLLIAKRDFEELSSITDKGIENSPYDSIIILYKAFALINLNKKYKAFRKLADHRNALKSFEGVRKTYYIKNTLIILMASLLGGSYISSLAITKFIEVLKKKSINFSSE